MDSIWIQSSIFQSRPVLVFSHLRWGVAVKIVPEYSFASELPANCAKHSIKQMPSNSLGTNNSAFYSVGHSLAYLSAFLHNYYKISIIS